MSQQRHTPIRTCVACRSTSAKASLLRVVRCTDGSVAYDAHGKAPGRGAYVCAAATCIDQARKHRKLEHALRVAAVPDNLFAILNGVAKKPVEHDA